MCLYQNRVVSFVSVLNVQFFHNCYLGVEMQTATLGMAVSLLLALSLIH